jgi:type II secretory pathway predicted ATPase ExeA
MYEKFFALTKAPFSLVPDPDCIHLTAQHADAISGLAFGVLERKGYLVLTAEAGLGKTTALRALSQLLAESNVASSMIFAPTLTAPEFLEMALLNFGFKDIPASKAQRLKLLEEFLVRSDAEGKVVALIVDEAHQLSPELLEEVRLLGNFETSTRKLLQLVLVGQNELNDRLNLPELRQLKQRITIRLSLQPLDREGVEEYIRFRWTKAGGAEPTPFSNAAIDAIASWSNGVSRLINVICDNALLIAFAEMRDTVDVQTVREACEELSVPTPRFTKQSPSFAGARPLKPPPEQIPAEAGEHLAPAAPSNGWAASQPSLLKRWLRLSGSQKHPPSRSASSTLSLDKP